MMSKRVLSIGQCMADHGSITRMLNAHFQVEIIPVDTSPEALDRLRQERFDLVLVNRVFDATGEGGIDLIRKIKNDHMLRGHSVMLVSNFPEAQDEAVAAGAIPGFGKNALAEQRTIEHLGHYLT